nr:MAG TPA: hypothetical protein [Caudoviricetes sp.]DAJ14776.1 MAG TPA: hypothetical protein [Siphoviridae sp. ctgbm9]
MHYENLGHISLVQMRQNLLYKLLLLLLVELFHLFFH